MKKDHQLKKLLRNRALQLFKRVLPSRILNWYFPPLGSVLFLAFIPRNLALFDSPAGLPLRSKSVVCSYTRTCWKINIDMYGYTERLTCAGSSFLYTSVAALFERMRDTDPFELNAMTQFT